MNNNSIRYPYQKIKNLEFDINDDIILIDHINGFSIEFKNNILDILDNFGKTKNSTLHIIHHEIFETKVKKEYTNLNLKFSSNLQEKLNLKHFKNYTFHPQINFKNFLCSFNGAKHVSRQLLTSCLNKFGLFNPNYCSKNFTNTIDEIDGHIKGYCGNERFYRKFFIDTNSQDFLKKVYSFGHVRFEHDNNIYNLESKLTESFVHIVSETIATSYYPFVTEKFLYSVVTRGLFLAYAQPNWHSHLEKYYGFKKYDKIFDYRFDSIVNPVERLIELVTMVSKFRHLSYDDLFNLYLMELDTINYNYDHYFSRQYIKTLQQYE